MSSFDVFFQLSSTRPWPLRAFLPVSRPSFYPTPIQYDISSNPRSSNSVYPTYSTMLSETSSPNSPRALPQMPLELILSFIEAACADTNCDERVLLLKTCSLVCKAWSTASQKVLFSRITLQSQRSFETFMNAVDPSTHHGRTLGGVVRGISFVLDNNQPCGLHHHSLALATAICPNLTQLEISLYGCAEPGEDIVGAPDVSRLRRPAPSFEEQTLSLLKSGPTIQYMHFDNWSENHQSIFQLLGAWSSLQFLSIGGTSPKSIQDSLPPFSCSLHGVRFKFQSPLSIDFMKWLLHNSADSLCQLDFERDPSFDALEFLLDAYGPQLQYISLPAFGSLDLAFLISKCRNLREIRTENPASPPGFYKQLPEGIESLAFGLDRDTPLNVIIDVIRTRDMLKTITVSLWESGHSHPLLSPLKMVCAYRGIGLSITTDLRVFRSMHPFVG